MRLCIVSATFLDSNFKVVPKIESSQAICNTAKTIAKPIIAEQIPKYKIDSVEFEELNLGSLPPTFQGSPLSLSFRFSAVNFWYSQCSQVLNIRWIQ